ncbi:ankyrin repeat domain-containing protein [Streptomyces sp. DSM 44915]|uniref:Ankyrin repeat domain-containing protein n=1 Tax=Streptomyces chisholmiae TaxID=3075540 RepID=A0ABU2JM76_9ACTN|nr:ankyrin repeat domain-containing protein [Streptomyces sp. DSM 44915]MDT0266075.1 ankyrin repeat domain-containing protein [Streptomyces sp. DSM 44915]
MATLRDALDAGADVEEAQFGTSLLYDAVDVEGDGSLQRGTPLHVDMTAFLLARGADPTRRSTSTGLTAEEGARILGHWLATELFEAWKRERNR